MARTKAYWENKSSKSNMEREGREGEGKNTGGFGSSIGVWRPLPELEACQDTRIRKKGEIIYL